ncbi:MULTISPECIES: DNA phosphorothioation-dependent restriction protein DptG [unclassified Exiguobacterium]|uniref:DNA phosphorothioation-dependent restriction protein DptG n=1 Tax=unclassified Exiguobacterium TaxID=2644629 RepID=UPI001BE7210B|nr:MULTISPECIES: DNA phosphorothioation-dependent restriction protein DptG [unclassified Exiguobacterium]
MTNGKHLNDFSLNWSKLESFFIQNKGYRYARRKDTYVLPLPTREPERSKFENGFWPITGGLARLLSNDSIVPEKDNLDMSDILSLGKFDSPETYEWFQHFLQSQQRKVEEADVSRLSQLPLLTLSEKKERKGQIDFINYVYGALIEGNEDVLSPLFTDDDNDDLLTQIFRSTQFEKEGSYSSPYPCLFPNIKNQFKQDLIHLSQNPKFFLDNLNHLLVHYTFIVISQTVLQTNRFTKFNHEKIMPLFFLMEWEKGARWRTSYMSGYKLLKEQVEDFYKHEHALNIVCQIPAIKAKKNLYYHHLDELLTSTGEDAVATYIQSLYDWMNNFYTIYTAIETPFYTPEKTLDEAFRDLAKSISSGLSNENKSRYPTAFDAFVLKFYKKHGGSLGSLLAVNQEQLLALIACSIKQEKIELNKLWHELEARGLFFDHHSKEEIVGLLDKLNYLEKKSDSGDAQYVKSIL